MGAQLLDFYNQAQALGGLKAKMRLAILTLVPSTNAESTPDSPENIQKFKNAMIELQKEFK